jgi:hypothetical protein
MKLFGEKHECGGCLLNLDEGYKVDSKYVPSTWGFIPTNNDCCKWVVFGVCDKSKTRLMMPCDHLAAVLKD